MKSPQPDETSPSSSPSPSPVEPPATGASLFSPPTLPPNPLDTSPGPSSETPPTSPLDPADAGDSASRPRSTSSAKRRQLRELATAVVAIVGGAAHRLLTRRESPEREAGLYLPDADDLDAISPPLAGILGRRLPEGADNPDFSDGVAILAGVVGYLFKQLDKREAIADAYAAAAADPGDALADQPSEVAL